MLTTQDGQAQNHTIPARALDSTWRPLLEGDIRKRALEVVGDIADDLRAGWPAYEGRTIATGPSLAGGAAGLAVFFAYLAHAHTEAGDEAAAGRWLGWAIDADSQAPVPLSLFGGLCGVAWATAHVRGLLPGLDREDVNEEIDETLLECLDGPPWRKEYDLVTGPVGFGVYALERLPRPIAIACLERVVAYLAEKAVRPSCLSSGGSHIAEVTWRVEPTWLTPEYRARYPRGVYDLGMAHGVPGVIALLARACAVGVAADTAWPLLDGAVRWLLVQRAYNEPAGFPAWIDLDGTPEPARLAWCYGDLGVSVSLLSAARCLGVAHWEQAALAIGRWAATRLPEQSGVVDAGLCHGAAGVGHLFNRLFQATGEACFADVSRYWFQRTLEMRQSGRGIGGYLAGAVGPEDAMIWRPEPGLLVGAAGIALALLSAATPIEPAWDRMLLASSPPLPTGSNRARRLSCLH